MDVLSVNDLLSAITLKLQNSWPDWEIFDSPPAASDGFCVRCTGQTRQKELGRRAKRTYSFEALCCLQNPDSVVYQEWAASMYSVFSDLDVQGKRYHLTGQRAAPAEGQGYLFQFQAAFWVLTAPDTTEKMEHLTQREAAE